MSQNVEKLCAVFVKIRDARTELKRVFDKRDEELKAQQEAINSAILDICKELNVESLKTAAGTAFRTVQTRYWVSDWEAAEAYIIEMGGFELMEKRLAQNAVKAWVEEFPFHPIPSLNADSRYKITIRRT